MTTLKIALITGSTRTPRAGNDIAAWVSSVLASRPTAATDNLEIVPISIASFNLPVFDEALMPAVVPAMGQFAHEHSRRWSDAMASFQGYVFVVPEYNWGLAGGTKNAIDYLYNELPGKPVAVVSYGVKGGNKANEQLCASLTIMKMRVVETRVLLPFAEGGDIMEAANKGTLGEASWKGWEEAKKGVEIVRALAEIRAVLDEVPKTE